MKIILILIVMAIIFNIVNYVKTRTQKHNSSQNLHINNSYNVWNPLAMKVAIKIECYNKYHSSLPEIQLNRNYLSMYLEWWGHNIGYYITKPFCFINFMNELNLRFKDVDLNEWMK